MLSRVFKRPRFNRNLAMSGYASQYAFWPTRGSRQANLVVKGRPRAVNVDLLAYEQMDSWLTKIMHM
jgi:hypothetical protein